MLRPRPDAATSAPSTLSLGETCWEASGRTDSSFAPMSDSVRPSEDISTGLPGGPSACEASEELAMLTDRPVYAILPTADVARLRRFYEDVLGFTVQ